MQRDFVRKWWRRHSPRLLAFCWIAGLIAGAAYSCFSADFCTVLIRRSTVQGMSFSGMMTVTTLPFLLSALVISLSEPWLLLVFSTFKAFSFSFCAWGVCLAFGQSSWLVLFLFLFSDFLLLPMLYFYWLRHIRGQAVTSLWMFSGLLFIALFVGMIDYQFISPFLASLVQ